MIARPMNCGTREDHVRQALRATVAAMQRNGTNSTKTRVRLGSPHSPAAIGSSFPRLIPEPVITLVIRINA